MTICKKFELSFVFFLNGLIEFAILHAIVTFHSGIFVVMCANTDYRCPMKLFFIGIQNFWAWVDKFWGIWGIFGYQHPFWYSESLVHVFHYSNIISTER